MTFTKAERDRIRLWLLKSPKSEDKNKNLKFVKDDGTEVHLSRNTVYSDNQKWKIRFAFHVDTGMFTGDTSGPIPGGQDTKSSQKVKHAMTEKFGPKKSPGIKFSEEGDAEIKKIIAAQMVDPIWAYMQAPTKSDKNGSVCWTVKTQKPKATSHVEWVIDSMGMPMEVFIPHIKTTLEYKNFGQKWLLPKNLVWKQIASKDAYVLDYKEGYVGSKSNASGNVGGGGSFQDMAESKATDPSPGHGDYGTELVDAELPKDNTIW